jgi:tetratricopeptide (TPR) repeat protein
MALTYQSLGVLARHRGSYDEAEALQRQALDISENIGNQAMMANAYIQLGGLAQDRGDYDGAEARAHQALTVSQGLGDQTNMAAAYSLLASLAETRGDYDGAEARARQALEIVEGLGDQDGMAAIHSALSDLNFSRGRNGRWGDRRRAADEAVIHAETALDISLAIGSHFVADIMQQLANALLNQGMVLNHFDELDEAVKVYDEVVSRFGGATDPALGTLVATAIYHKAVALARRDDWDHAMTAYEDLLGRFNDIESADRQQVGNTLMERGVTLARGGNLADAMKVWDMVVTNLGEKTEQAARDLAAEALVNKGATLFKMGRVQDAVVVYEQVLEFYSGAPERVTSQAEQNKRVASAS